MQTELVELAIAIVVIAFILFVLFGALLVLFLWVGFKLLLLPLRLLWRFGRTLTDRANRTGGCYCFWSGTQCESEIEPDRLLDNLGREAAAADLVHHPWLRLKPRSGKRTYQET